MYDLKNLTMDKLLGTLIAYEMIVRKEKFEAKEEAFKVSMKAKEHKDHQYFSSYEYDQEMAQFSRKPKRG